MIALEKLVCFYKMRPVFIAKLHLPIAYLYYLMVLTVKDYKQHSICVRQSLLIAHTMTAIFLIMTSNFVIADIVNSATDATHSTDVALVTVKSTFCQHSSSFVITIPTTPSATVN